MDPQDLQLTLGFQLTAEQPMNNVYIYVVDRDFGFAPNPFHGYCTLATCKPGIRKKAKIGDWIVGLGGRRLKATGRCIFAMCVTEIINFNEYWSNPVFFDKRPVRNGSSRMMVGDNIYHFDFRNKLWCQADSHHSCSDGSVNIANLKRDTSSDQVLISRQFFYFGKNAPKIPDEIISEIGYKNRIGQSTYDEQRCVRLIDWLFTNFGLRINFVQGDPFDFEISGKRYSGLGSRVA
jgi:hypothetical protein